MKKQLMCVLIVTCLIISFTAISHAGWETGEIVKIRHDGTWIVVSIATSPSRTVSGVLEPTVANQQLALLLTAQAVDAEVTGLLKAQSGTFPTTWWQVFDFE